MCKFEIKNFTANEKEDCYSLRTPRHVINIHYLGTHPIKEPDEIYPNNSISIFEYYDRSEEALYAGIKGILNDYGDSKIVSESIKPYTDEEGGLDLRDHALDIFNALQAHIPCLYRDLYGIGNSDCGVVVRYYSLKCMRSKMQNPSATPQQAVQYIAQNYASLKAEMDIMHGRMQAFHQGDVWELQVSLTAYDEVIDKFGAWADAWADARYGTDTWGGIFYGVDEALSAIANTIEQTEPTPFFIAVGAFARTALNRKVKGFTLFFMHAWRFLLGVCGVSK